MDSPKALERAPHGQVTLEPPWSSILRLTELVERRRLLRVGSRKGGYKNPPGILFGHRRAPSSLPCHQKRPFFSPLQSLLPLKEVGEARPQALSSKRYGLPKLPRAPSDPSEYAPSCHLIP